jgi:DnaJ-class molecular chaperone
MSPPYMDSTGEVHFPSRDDLHTYRIHQPCESCGGTGRREFQIGAASFRSEVCFGCGGDGDRVFEERYDSEREVAEDYPRALAVTLLGRR